MQLERPGGVWNAVCAHPAGGFVFAWVSLDLRTITAERIASDGAGCVVTTLWSHTLPNDPPGEGLLYLKVACDMADVIVIGQSHLARGWIVTAAGATLTPFDVIGQNGVAIRAHGDAAIVVAVIPGGYERAVLNWDGTMRSQESIPNPIPPSQGSPVQGWLEFRPGDTAAQDQMVWTDLRRTVTVNGTLLILATSANGVYAGQSPVAEQCDAVRMGNDPGVSTPYVGSTYEPQIAFDGAIYAIAIRDQRAGKAVCVVCPPWPAQVRATSSAPVTPLPPAPPIPTAPPTPDPVPVTRGTPLNATVDPSGPDLSQASILNSPSDLASWPITTHLTSLALLPDGVHPVFDNGKQDGPTRWPDITPPGWQGPLQFTLGMVMSIAGQLYASAPIEFWFGLDKSGGPPEEYGKNWFYDVTRWGPMCRQPNVGEKIGFFVMAGDGRNNLAGSLSPVKERSNVVWVPMPDAAGASYTFPTDVPASPGVPGGGPTPPAVPVPPATGTPPPPPPSAPSVDLTAVLDAIAKLSTAQAVMSTGALTVLQAIADNLAAVKTELDALKTAGSVGTPGTIAFPTYTGSVVLLGQTLRFTLKPNAS